MVGLQAVARIFTEQQATQQAKLVNLQRRMEKWWTSCSSSMIAWAQLASSSLLNCVAQHNNLVVQFTIFLSIYPSSMLMRSRGFLQTSRNLVRSLEKIF